MIKNESKKMKCCICKKEFERCSNNPFPIAGDSCCNDCNMNVVVPLRMFYSSLDKQNMALWIKKDSLEIVKPKDNEYFTLKELQTFVGGYIEILGCSIPKYIIICDEEGTLKGLEFNTLAHLTFETELVGNILICPLKIFEKPEEDDE